jgi:hypothetical protein
VIAKPHPSRALIAPGGAFWLLFALLACAALYLPGLGGPLLFDDAPNLQDNALLVRPKPALLDWWAAAQSSGAGFLRRPVAMLSFALEGSLDGLQAPLLKSVNLAIHLCCGVLLYLLAAQLLRAMDLRSGHWRWLPPLAAALWLLNPLLLSTVLYAVQRMAQLSTLFVLAGLYLYARFRARWSERAASIDELLALCLWLLLCTALAVLSKENGVLLPWLVLVLEATLLRGRYGGRVRPPLRRLAMVAALLPVVLAALLTGYFDAWVNAGYRYRDFTLGERLLTELRVLWQYLQGMVLPRPSGFGLFHDDLMISRGWLSPLTTLYAAAAWTMVLVVAVLLRKRFPWLLLAAAFFLVAHSLESGPLALELVFEHRNYLPAVGIALGLAAALLQAGAWLAARGAAPRLALLPALVVLLLFTANLLQRSLTWSSELSMASAAYARHPASPRSALFYANTLLKLRTAPGTGNAEAGRLLTLARHEFEALQQRRPTELSALVMLYTLDSRFFAQVGAPDRWLEAIERSVEAGRLKATELAAMRVLLACVRDGGCAPDPQRLQRIVERFAASYHYPEGSLDLQLQLAEMQGASPSTRSDLLEATLALRPGALGSYYPLIEAQLAQGDYPAVHETLLRLLREDRAYRQLVLVDALFGTPDSTGSPL